jgi:hypothetical protein
MKMSNLMNETAMLYIVTPAAAAELTKRAAVDRKAHILASAIEVVREDEFVCLKCRADIDEPGVFVVVMPKEGDGDPPDGSEAKVGAVCQSCAEHLGYEGMKQVALATLGFDCEAIN